MRRNMWQHNILNRFKVAGDMHGMSYELMSYEFMKYSSIASKYGTIGALTIIALAH